MSSSNTTRQNNARLPRGFSYSARTVRPKAPKRDHAPEPRPGLDTRVYLAGTAMGEKLEQAGDGIVRIGHAVQRAGDRVQRSAEKLAMYVAAAQDIAADEE